VLEKYASNASQDELRTVVELSDVTYVYWQPLPDCRTERRKLDCSAVRQLARQELIRRELKD